MEEMKIFTRAALAIMFVYSVMVSAWAMWTKIDNNRLAEENRGHCVSRFSEYDTELMICHASLRVYRDGCP